MTSSDTTVRTGIWRVLLAPSGKRGKWITLLLWVVLLGATAGAAARLESVQSQDPANSRPSDTQSALVAQALEDFPGGDAIPAVIAYERVGGLTEADLAKIATDAITSAQIVGAPPQAAQPIPSADGEAAIIVLPFTPDDGDALTATVDELRTAVGEAPGGDDTGLRIAVTGAAGVIADLSQVFSGVNTNLLLATSIVVALLLLITYRSPILWAIPLFAVVIGDYLSRAGMTYLVEIFGATVDGQIAGITLVLVFGVGTDYALLLISRYREELRKMSDRHEAMARAMRGAGEAILASAATVGAGLLCLLAATVGTTRGLGPAGFIGVICALLAAMTLLPALMVIFGRWVFWPFIPREGSTPPVGKSIWGRVGRGVARRPRTVWIGGILVLVALTGGLVKLDLGLSLSDNFRGEAASVDGQEIIAAHFPEGEANRTTVLVRPGTEAAATDAIDGVTNVAAVEPGPQNGTWSQLLVTIDADPQGDVAYQAVRDMRAALADLPETEALVGGDSADNLDFDVAQTETRNRVVPLVLGSVFLLLCLFLRSIVAPLLLLGTTVLSFAAAMGLTAFVSSEILGFERFDVSLPLLAFVFLVALGVDYNIFLAVRAREEAARYGTRIGMLRALAVTGGVITSAGIVLAATFTVLGVLPFVALAQIGLAVALGVLLDTLLVRTLVVPGLVVDIGKRTWWPNRLAKDSIPEPAPGSRELVDSLPR
jgi:RND superfamily putative drug exporter